MAESCNNISSLGSDLLVEILCRVGATKQAIRCKSVCKLWCSIVDTSHFPQRWRHMNNNLTSSLPVTLLATYGRGRFALANFKEEDEEFTTSLDFLPCRGSNRKKLRVLGCDKDLVLCSCLDDMRDSRCYYVGNPLTKQWTALPTVEELEEEGLLVVPIAGLLVHSNGQFTAVLMACRTSPVKCWVFIFSSDRGGLGWRRIDAVRTMELDIQTFVPYKEAFVCVMRPTLPDGPFPKEDCCFVLDPRDGQFTRLPFPRAMGGHRMGVSQGRLRVAEVVFGTKIVVVWEFNDNNRTLEKVQEMDLGWEEGWLQDMGFHPLDRDVLFLMYSRRLSLRNGDCTSFISMRALDDNEKKERPIPIPTEVPVLVRELPEPLNACFSLHVPPLVQQCWPTPIPPISD